MSIPALVFFNVFFHVNSLTLMMALHQTVIRIQLFQKILKTGQEILLDPTILFYKYMLLKKKTK